MSSKASFHVYLYGPNRAPLLSSFEETEARLIEIPSLSFEPDGSFGWVDARSGEQIFGMLYDAGGAIQYCELRGTCSYQCWAQLCRKICHHEDPAVIQVMTLPDQVLEDLQRFERNVWNHDLV